MQLLLLSNDIISSYVMHSRALCRQLRLHSLQPGLTALIALHLAHNHLSELPGLQRVR
jgi:hypothetical protein